VLAGGALSVIESNCIIKQDSIFAAIMRVLGSGWKWGVVPSVASPGALKRIEQKVTKGEMNALNIQEQFTT
jgi:hypothetical protein